MDITVILATYKPLALKSTLESLAACTLPLNFSRTIIVENGTPEPTLKDELLPFQSKLNITSMHCKEGNKSNALNYAIDSIQKNQLLFLTDDDVLFDSEVLVHYSNAAAGLSGGYVFGGKIVPDSQAPPPAELEPFVPASMKGYPIKNRRFDVTKTMFIGPNWAVFSDDVKRLGGFDPRFGPGSKLKSTGQESQMMRAMRKADFQFVFVENAVVKHHVKPNNYTVEFLKDRRIRAGVEAGQKHRLESSSFLKWVPPWKIVGKAILNPLLIPFAFLMGSKETFYKALFEQRFAFGFMKGWLCFQHRDNDLQ